MDKKFSIPLNDDTVNFAFSAQVDLVCISVTNDYEPHLSNSSIK